MYWIKDLNSNVVSVGEREIVEYLLIYQWLYEDGLFLLLLHTLHTIQCA